MTGPALQSESQDVRGLVHDLRAPLVNIDGFSGELREAVEQLAALLEQHAQDLPAGFRDEATALLRRDITQCLGFIESSIAQLNDRVDEFAHQAGASAARASS